MRTWTTSFLIIALLLGIPASAEQSSSPDYSSALEAAAHYRREGNLRLATEVLESARKQAGAACPARVLGELGATYFQSNRLVEAEAALREAYAKSDDDLERALFANDLGNLSASRGHRDEALHYYEEARRLGASDASIAASAGLNLARLQPPQERLQRLQALQADLRAVPEASERARYLVNLGAQARELGPGATRLAFESLTEARRLADALPDDWLSAQALDGLAQLYEDRGRGADALKLTDQAIEKLRAEPEADLLIALQWRRGRLLRAQGRDDLALQAYQLAVERIERVRQDIPVTYVDGRSSFRETLEPVYLGLAELLLRQAGSASGDNRAQLYRRARGAVELIKQTELQDYLGDRCLVQSDVSLSGAGLPRGVAVVYPVILDQQLALLIETPDGIEARQVPVNAETLREKALEFARAVREAAPGYLPLARELYDLLLRPLEPVLARNGTDTLIVVPDGALRLVPLAALHDGERFVVSKYAVAIAPGLTLGSAGPPTKTVGPVLLAGLSQPGPVVNKLPAAGLEALSSGLPTRGTRAVSLTQGLALPGVSEEIQALRATTRGDRLLNEEFTASRFREEVGSGKYRVVHIASHAVFSRSAQSSFILAYDDLLTLDELQTLLRSGEVQSNPIDLLSLSACQTAEGDDRAPLGIAGAALRARAGSALGSLWPVDDAATKTLMVRFYELLAKEGLSKGKALQRAQAELLANPTFQHPFYWAPFILVGDWK
jgi:CHAT domain-containing protein/predicted negative regulator of RcsB-dependent stress response